ncbi:MAG TPA: helix-turn-helix transcriptional regulator, partial [Candidatus Barnesiella merdipullorum]|nr:helix-turn-helix transcriptional regulator [Candidatus Barnesiella merdipullorum]
MNLALYDYSLGIALVLMLFFAFYFLVGKTPDKPIFVNYLRSRRIMGAALLVLSANYSVHLFCGLRPFHHQEAILMNFSTYFMAYWLFSAALTTLLDRFYLTRRRFWRHMGYWALFTALSALLLIAVPSGPVQQVGLVLLALWLLAYGLWLARRLIRTYRWAVRLFDDTHSEYIAAYIRWMSIFTWWAVIYGVSCGLLTFLPDRYLFLWVLSSIPFYIYLFDSYINYLLFYEQVESILEQEPPEDIGEPIPVEDGMSLGPQPYRKEIEGRLAAWIGSQRYTSPKLTIGDLALELGTNRTYLSAYIKDTYQASFREWIAGLRIEYAKQQMVEHPDLTIAVISEESGFLSLSYFSRIFTEKEG